MKMKICKTHNNRVCEKILVRNKTMFKYEELYKGSYPINNIWKNVTFTILWGAVQERIDIKMD